MPKGSFRPVAKTAICSGLPGLVIPRKTLITPALLSATNMSPLGDLRISRGSSRPDAYSSTLKPGGTCGQAFAGRDTTLGPLPAEGVGASLSARVRVGEPSGHVVLVGAILIARSLRAVEVDRRVVNILSEGDAASPLAEVVVVVHRLAYRKGEGVVLGAVRRERSLGGRGSGDEHRKGSDRADKQHGARRRSTFKMSRIAAPLGDVTIPIRVGNFGSARFRAGSKSPSASSFRLSASNLACNMPRPRG